MLNNFKAKIAKNEKVKIVCLGDSMTFGYQIGTKKQVENPYPKVLEQLLKKDGIDVEVINSGKSGWRTINTLSNMAELVHDHQPDLCIIMLGINDARGSFKGITLSKYVYERNMKKMIDEIKNDGTSVLVLSPTPTSNNRVNKFSRHLLEELETTHLPFLNMYYLLNKKFSGVPFFDIYPDGVHMADEHYSVIAEIVYEEIFRDII